MPSEISESVRFCINRCASFWSAAVGFDSYFLRKLTISERAEANLLDACFTSGLVICGEFRALMVASAAATACAESLGSV